MKMLIALMFILAIYMRITGSGIDAGVRVVDYIDTGFASDVGRH